ncbi:hypothetical protein TraAM80_03347 [Trypanosoma rangeli]|uniref:Fucosyltransferase n=1 Tax=Trypanosoma rangeli TaxID=5698 RepID=A0A422NPY1_TRYRA|nr:uncharacterized protein TraAM80_03347 [Trypanosoma rangeli]RNF07491.1 hypothetical protein TraAM80_03347 [Trypanosoma rangeli]|eukprot:RNF07491.1 hypothetical protein TraAM80_03347 [Trypanosoma rangeli]
MARVFCVRQRVWLRVVLLTSLLLACVFIEIVSVDEADTHAGAEGHVEATLQRWMDTYLDTASALLSNLTPPAGDSDNDTKENQVFCDAVVKRMWEDVIPLRYNIAFKKVLVSHRRRHTAVSLGNPEANQKYIVWSLSGGLGNRVQALVSVLLAALLSGRVILMKDWFTPLQPSGSPPVRPTVLPFVTYGNTSQEAFRYENLRELFWFSNDERSSRVENEFMFCSMFPVMSLSQFEKIYPEEFRRQNNSTEVALFKDGHAKIDIRAGHDKKLRLWKHLACGDTSTTGEVDFFSREKFIYIWTNQYFLPLFYANKRTKPIMHAWFSRDPFRSLLPLVFLPARPAMYRVVRYMRLNALLKRRRYVGLHIRSFSRHKTGGLVKSFFACVNQFAARAPSPPTFFLASMYREAKSYFSVNPLKKGARVVSLDSDQKGEGQGTGQGPVPEWEALADVVILSLSSHLFLSPASTYGFLAAAAGEVEFITFVKARSLDAGRSEDTRCVRVDANAVTEPCFTSWFRLDFIRKRRQQMRCELGDLPSWALHCGTNM